MRGPLQSAWRGRIKPILDCLVQANNFLLDQLEETKQTDQPLLPGSAFLL